MKKIKLFEELQNCFLSKEDIVDTVDQYLNSEYIRLFSESIDDYLMDQEDEDDYSNIVDIIDYFSNEEIKVSYNEDTQFDGYADLMNDIKSMAEQKARYIVRERIQQILKQEAEKDIDNYLNHKKLYNEWDVKLPSNLERGKNSGLLDIKK